MVAMQDSRRRATLLVLFTLFLVSSGFSVFAQTPIVRDSQGNLKSPFAAVYEKVSPCVVKIDVEETVQQSQMNNPWQRFFNIPQQQQGERVQQGVGSGVIVDRDGRVLTNNHVVADAKNIKVVVNDNEVYEAEVVGKDPETDLAVIKMNLKGKTIPASSVAELGNSDEIRPGDYAIAIGNPLGLDRTITVGVVSAVGRTGLPVQGTLRYQNFIQTDAQINPGNSGGALCDINGRIIGINDMYTAQYAGIGFAIPINLARSVMTKLIATGKVERGFFGIQGKDVDKGTKDALDLPTTDGVLVNTIVKNSPADKAGIKVGDVILSIDGQKVKNGNDFSFKIAAHNPGDTVTLETIREGAKTNFQVKLANRDEFKDASMPSGAGESVWRGIHVVNLDNEQYKNYVPENIKSGVLVVDIDDNSPAAASQLREGDIITEINIARVRKLIKNIQDFDALKQQMKDSKRPMLVYRTEMMDNGMVVQGFVTVDSD
jgi:serine protease Do